MEIAEIFGTCSVERFHGVLVAIAGPYFTVHPRIVSRRAIVDNTRPNVLASFAGFRYPSPSQHSAEENLAYTYSRVHRITELSAISTFAMLAAALGWKLGTTLDGVLECIVLGASVIAGYVLADLISGIVHWLADRYGTETMPLLGANFIRPFRQHHVDPKAISHHDFIETNGSNCIVSTPFLGLAFFFLPIEPSLITTFLHGGTLAFCLAIFATNQFHKWAHMDSPPSFLKPLQKLSLVLTPEHHDVHHSAPYDRNYCITCGWWNPFLERVKLFQRAENGLAVLTGRRPADRVQISRQAESCSMGTFQFDQD